MRIWSKVKARLRALKARTGPALLDALVTAFAAIPRTTSRGGFGIVDIGSHSLEKRYRTHVDLGRNDHLDGYRTLLGNVTHAHP